MKKPGTFINANPRALRPDYVMVGAYRITRSHGSWWVWVASDGEWEKQPDAFRTKQLAMEAIDEHKGSGELSRPTVSLRARVARLEKKVRELEQRLDRCC